MLIKEYDGRKTCYQKLRKVKMRKYESKIEFDKSTAVVREISYQEAKEVILNYEWLGTMPSAPWKQYGLFLNDTIVAVECFARVRSGNTSYTYLKYPAISLARGASIGHAPPWAGSYLISRSLKLVAQELNNEPHYVLAYSDWEAGELGHIYQACSWIYTGHRKSPEWRSPEGDRKDSSYHRQQSRKYDPDYKVKRKLNPKVVRQTRQKLLDEGWYMSHTIRGRYVTVIGRKSSLKKEMVAELELRSVPYVKTHENFEDSKELTPAQVRRRREIMA